MITRVRKYIRDNRMLKAEDMVVAGAVSYTHLYKPKAVYI